MTHPMKALQDALLHGQGYICISAEGRASYLPPERVLQASVEDDLPAQELAALLRSQGQAAAAESVLSLSRQNAALKELLVDAGAHLAGAVSAYEVFACRHEKFGKPDPDALYGTRLQDFQKSKDRVLSMIRELTK